MVRGAVSVILLICVEVVGPNITDESLCTSADTSTDVLPIALMNSLRVSEVGSFSFSFVDWVVFMESCKRPVV